MILCAGEALIDMLPRRTTEGEEAFAPAVGGSVFNTAIALGRLAAPTALITGLSRDLFGERLEAALAASGVDSSLAHRSDRPTTLAFVELNGGQARYAFYDENTAGRMLSESDLPATLTGATALFCGGISLMVEPCATTYEALCLRESPRMPVMLDPNIRPSFIRDEAAYRARLDRMLAATDIVKVSDEDLHWLAGNGTQPDLVARLMERGPKLVCVTEGAAGVVAYHPGGNLRVPARAVHVVDTVGAGDTFNAGLLAGLHEAGALSKAALEAPSANVIEAAVLLGVRASAVTVSRAGANPPTRAELGQARG